MQKLSHQLALKEQELMKTMTLQLMVMKKMKKDHQFQLKMIFNKKPSPRLDKILPIGVP